jgi:hypothetical protein
MVAQKSEASNQGQSTVLGNGRWKLAGGLAKVKNIEGGWRTKARRTARLLLYWQEKASGVLGFFLIRK